MTCRVYRTISEPHASWLTHLGPAEAQLLGLQEHRALAEGWEQSFYLGWAVSSEEPTPLLDGSCWLLVFWESVWKGGTVSPLRRETSVFNMATSLSLFCCAGCAQVCYQVTLSKEKAFRLPLKMGDGDSVGSREGIQESLTAPLDFQPAVLISAACCALFAWAFLELCVETTSVPVGFYAYRLRFQLSLYFVKSVTIFLLSKYLTLLPIVLSFSSCLCGFKPFQYSFIAISGESLERVELQFPIHCFHYFLKLFLSTLFWDSLWKTTYSCILRHFES